ncbi:MAG: hypothetical protein KJ556_20345 [Gammaproteobacteria bacterium]|nr:hypothetical protein [Gammaproteobacteria bacterium]
MTFRKGKIVYVNGKPVWTPETEDLTINVNVEGAAKKNLVGEGDLTADGTEQCLIEETGLGLLEGYVDLDEMESGDEVVLVSKEDNKLGYLEGHVDLTPMQTGDTIVVKEYMQIKAAGAYVLYATKSYSDAQDPPLLHVQTKPAKDKIKVTATQTAGTNRTLDVQFYRRLEA